jgi:hypothetical protein
VQLLRLPAAAAAAAAQVLLLQLQRQQQHLLLASALPKLPALTLHASTQSLDPAASPYLH